MFFEERKKGGKTMYGRKMTAFLSAMIMVASGMAARAAVDAAAGKEPVAFGEKRADPLRVCVLDFATIDTVGDQRFLAQRNRTVDIPAQCTLNDADRKSINSIMQGFVRLIDAWDNTRTHTENRRGLASDNAFDRARALELYRTAVKGEARPVVIGAEYLAAYLGQHPEVFACMDASGVEAAMAKLPSEPDFPRDFLRRLGAASGATHLIYGTVSDIRRQEKTFQGYGVATKTTDYQLDVLIRMVDLAEQRVMYGNVYTGRYQERQPVSGSSMDDGVFQALMKSALEQAAEDLCKVVQEDKAKEATVVSPRDKAEK